MLRNRVDQCRGCFDGFSKCEENGGQLNAAPRDRKRNRVVVVGEIIIERIIKLSAREHLAVFLRKVKGKRIRIFSEALIDDAKDLAICVVEIYRDRFGQSFAPFVVFAENVAP